MPLVSMRSIPLPGETLNRETGLQPWALRVKNHADLEFYVLSAFFRCWPAVQMKPYKFGDDDRKKDLTQYCFNVSQSPCRWAGRANVAIAQWGV